MVGSNKKDADFVIGINGTLMRCPRGTMDPTEKLVYFLRQRYGLRSTKVACGEGGCGSCAVLLSRFDPVMKKVVTISVNACLRPVVACHGWHVMTSEGIGSQHHPRGYHDLQQRFAQLNASQCGFCTPGFVVATFAQYAKNPQSTMSDIEAALDGNTCRCTGYRPIFDAAKSFATDSDVVDRIGGEPLPKSEGVKAQEIIDELFPAELKTLEPTACDFTGSNVTYHRAASVIDVIRAFSDHKDTMIVCAQTSTGVYKSLIPDATRVIDVSYIPELNHIKLVENKTALSVGGAVPIATLVGALLEHGSKHNVATSQAFSAVANMLSKVGNVHVRNIGSVGGNISMTKERGFASDMCTPLCVLDAKITYVRIPHHGSHEQRADSEAFTASFASDGGDKQQQQQQGNVVVIPVHHCTTTLYEFLHAPSEPHTTSFVISVVIPFQPDGAMVQCYRTAIRSANAHAIANGAFKATVTRKGVVKSITAIYGALGEFDEPGHNAPKKNEAVANAVLGKVISKGLIRDILASFDAGDFVSGTYKKAHRQRLVKAFLIKFLEDARVLVKGEIHIPNSKVFCHESDQKFTISGGLAPIGRPVPRPEGKDHAAGTAVFVSDIKEPANALYAAVVYSEIAKGTFDTVNRHFLTHVPGLFRFITADDLPAWCTNELVDMVKLWGAPAPNYPMFAKNKEVSWYGEPIGLVLCDTQQRAISAAQAIMKNCIEYKEARHKIITLADAAADPSHLPALKQEMVKGDITSVNTRSDFCHLATTVSMGSQKHFYLETHAAYATFDDRGVHVHGNTHWPEYSQLAVAHLLSLPIADVHFEQFRAGGSFGAKGNPYFAGMAAVAARMTNRPVKLHLDRNTDMQIQGGREEMEAAVEISFKPDGKIEGLEMSMQKNIGCTPGLSFYPVTISLPRHTCSLYDISHLQYHLFGFTSNTPTRTATRGPGEVEAALISEAIIDRVAAELNVHSQSVRESNFADKGYKGIMGDEIPDDETFTFPSTYQKMMGEGGWRSLVEHSLTFNDINHIKKKGVAVVPYQYFVSISRANAMVNIYRDGSVLVHHSGCEMGQGLQIKALQAACMHLSHSLFGAECRPIDLEIFKAAGNDTDAIASGGVTGGSTTSESVVVAVRRACNDLTDRLKAFAEKATAESQGKGLSTTELWKATVAKAIHKKTLMQALGQCDGSSGPNPEDLGIEYPVYVVGGAMIELDVLTGEVIVERVDIKYDSGCSLNPAVDIGQVEGGFVMGMGLVLLEDAKVNPTSGKLEHDGTWDYKIPGARDVPLSFNVELIQNEAFKKGVLSSKASGEPPLCVAPAVASAIRQAIQSARKDLGLGGFPPMSYPFTTDKIAVACGMGDAVEH